MNELTKMRPGADRAGAIGRLAFLVLVCWLTVFQTAVFAEVGGTKSQIERQYGSPGQIKDSGGKVWTQSEWQKISGKKPAIAGYGYRTKPGPAAATVWVEYDRKNIVVAETTVLDKPLAVQNFKSLFPGLYTGLTAPGSIIFEVREDLRSELGAAFRNSANRFLVARFVPDGGVTGRIDKNTKIRSFTMTTGVQTLVLERLRQGEKAAEQEDGLPPAGGLWARTANYFRGEFTFVDPLVPRKATDMIVIHHTAIEDMTAEDIHTMHLANGWSGIGYHYVIRANGLLETGRPEEIIGAHAAGANETSIGISLVGNFENHPPTAEQMKALVALTGRLMDKYRIPLSRVFPHRQVTAGTVCPGQLFPWDSFINSLKTRKAAPPPPKKR